MPDDGVETGGDGDPAADGDASGATMGAAGESAEGDMRLVLTPDLRIAAGGSRTDLPAAPRGMAETIEVTAYGAETDDARLDETLAALEAAVARRVDNWNGDQPPGPRLVPPAAPPSARRGQRDDDPLLLEPADRADGGVGRAAPGLPAVEGPDARPMPAPLMPPPLPQRDGIRPADGAGAALETTDGTRPAEEGGGPPRPAEAPPEDAMERAGEAAGTPREADRRLVEALGSLDEAALRRIVAEVVRSELQGALGERITRNVRKLVRREIYRALASEDAG